MSRPPQAMSRPSLLLCLAALGAGCFVDDGRGLAGPTSTGAPDAGSVVGAGTDDATTARCLSCHETIAAAWSNLSSHQVLLDCNGCHALGTTFPHAMPVTLPVCATCHSEHAHPAGGDACTTCHDPHGSPNVFLIRPVLDLPGGGTAEIHFTQVEGASADGLARAGVAGEKAGTGLCEVCHASTAHYDSAGTGTPHETKWCGGCHDHQGGFAPP